MEQISEFFGISKKTLDMPLITSGSNVEISLLKVSFFNQETQTKNFLCQVWTTLVCFGPLDSQA